MTPKTVMGLGVVTLVAVVAAAVSVSANRLPGTDPVEKPVFEGLEDKINSAVSLTVRSVKDTVTVERAAGTWRVTEKAGFPADAERVRQVLFELSQLTLMEPKTQMPERYARIQVEDVDTKDAKSSFLAVKDESGASLAELIIGKAKNGLAGVTGKGVYLRKPDQQQAWLARGELDLRTGVNAWLAKGIVDIDAKKIQRVTTTRPDGSVIVFSKADPSATEFEVGGLPDGKTVKKDEIKDVGAVLSGLNLADVQPADQKKLPDDKLIQAEVVTFDGLVVNIDMEETEDGIWARFEASAGGDNAEVAKQAEDLNARVKGWVYQIPDFKVRPILKKADELIAS